MIPRLGLPALGERDRRALRIGARIALPALAVALVVRPWVETALGAGAALRRERALLEREASLLAEAPRDRQLLAASRRALEAAAPRLFEGAEPVTSSAELARYVAAQATGSGLTIDQTETVLDDAADSLAVPASERPLRVAVRAHGDVLAVVAFLRAVETGPRLVRVERLGLARGAEGTPADGALAVTATLAGLARAGFAPDPTTIPLGASSGGRLAAGGAP